MPRDASPATKPKRRRPRIKRWSGTPITGSRAEAALNRIGKLMEAGELLCGDKVNTINEALLRVGGEGQLRTLWRELEDERWNGFANADVPPIPAMYFLWYLVRYHRLGPPDGWATWPPMDPRWRAALEGMKQELDRIVASPALGDLGSGRKKTKRGRNLT
jgi:hypothetical protein